MNSSNVIKILSRKSDLAIIQAKQVGFALQKKFPYLSIEYLSKNTGGDIDLKTPLSQMSTPGVFTEDLRDALLKDQCDIAVHSWKDLPLELGKDTLIAGTLRRADQRDILFIEKRKINSIKNSKSITILSSSPRRIYNLESFLRNFLPFKCEDIKFKDIRGNIPTRFKKFLDGDGDALVVAKAAIDRLILNNFSEFKDLSRTIKNYIDMCNWMITPLSENPTSPGQGALGLEVKKNNTSLIDMINKISDPLDMKCVENERKILEKYGGGCHQKIGVSFFPTFFGLMKSEKIEINKGEKIFNWHWYNKPKIKKQIVKKEEIFPSDLKINKLFKRNLIYESIEKINSISNHCIWISRKSALPNEATISSSNIVWTSGLKTWKALAKRGVWVNGTADGMGEDTNPNLSVFSNFPWIKLTHNKASVSAIKNILATYELEELPIKENFKNKLFFYWMSYSAFKYISKKNPNIIKANHACGPGNTYKEIKKMLNDSNKLEIVLSYEEWKKDLINEN